MTRQQKINAVFELLPPREEERAERAHDLEQAFDSIEGDVSFARARRVLSSKAKGGLLRHLALLRRVQESYYGLDPAIRPWLRSLKWEIGKTQVLLAQPPYRAHDHTHRFRAAPRRNGCSHGGMIIPVSLLGMDYGLGYQRF